MPLIDRWQRLRSEIDDFRRYLCAESQPIEVIHACDWEWSKEQYKSNRPNGFPQTRGVYVFYDAAGEVLYVGKAIFIYDKRVWAHSEIEEARYLDIIPFDDRHISLALALEFFLITRLKPKYNKHYKEYDVPRGATAPLNHAAVRNCAV